MSDSRSLHREGGGHGSSHGRGEWDKMTVLDSLSTHDSLTQLLENRVVHICSAFAMRRSDKQPDRVEISPEQLSAAAIEAEVREGDSWVYDIMHHSLYHFATQQLALKLKRPIQVLGWYHSHPHITVWPSHVGESLTACSQAAVCAVACGSTHDLTN